MKHVIRVKYSSHPGRILLTTPSQETYAWMNQPSVSRCLKSVWAKFKDKRFAPDPTYKERSLPADIVTPKIFARAVQDILSIRFEHETILVEVW